MAILNEKLGYLFLAEPYCASRSIELALQCLDDTWNMDIWTHATKEDLIKHDRISHVENLFVFSVVRHPADLLVTRYHHLTGWHKVGFKAFLNYVIDNPPESRSMYMHAKATDQTVKYENLEEHLNALLESFGSPTVELPKIGKTEEKKHWQDYYLPHEMDRLRETYTDFKTYGYT